MALESFGFIDDLDVNSPAGTDSVSQGDNHLRGIKDTLQNTFYKSDGTTNWDKGIKADPDDVTYGSVPVGGAIIWTGAISAIPSNKRWALMNGTANSTGSAINLTGKFVVFADADASGTLDVGDTGGLAFSSKALTSATSTTGATVDSHSLTEAELPAHYHQTMKSGLSSDSPASSRPIVTNYNQPGDSSYTMRGDIGGNADVGRSSSVGSGEAHTHGLTDSGHSHTVTPPYYALAYIERLPNP